MLACFLSLFFLLLPLVHHFHWRIAPKAIDRKMLRGTPFKNISLSLSLLQFSFLLLVLLLFGSYARWGIGLR